MVTCMHDMYGKLENIEASRFFVELSASRNSMKIKFSCFVSVWHVNDWLLLLVGAIFSHFAPVMEANFSICFRCCLIAASEFICTIFHAKFYPFGPRMLTSISNEKFWGIFIPLTIIETQNYYPNITLIYKQLIQKN